MPGKDTPVKGNRKSQIDNIFARKDAAIAYKLKGAYTLDEIKSKTREFYSTFFNVSVGDDVLKAIYRE